MDALIGNLSLSSAMYSPSHASGHSMGTVESPLPTKLSYMVPEPAVRAAREAFDPKWTTEVPNFRGITVPEPGSFQVLIADVPRQFDIFVNSGKGLRLFCSLCSVETSPRSDQVACKHMFWLQDQLARYHLATGRRNWRDLAITEDALAVTVLRSSGVYQSLPSAWDIIRNDPPAVVEFMRNTLQVQRIQMSLKPISYSSSESTSKIYNDFLELVFRCLPSDDGWSWEERVPDESIFVIEFNKMKLFAEVEYLFKLIDVNDAAGEDLGDGYKTTVEYLRKFSANIGEHIRRAGEELSETAAAEAVDALRLLLTAVVTRRRSTNGSRVCRRLMKRASDGSFFMLDALSLIPADLLDDDRVRLLQGDLNGLHNWAPVDYQEKMAAILRG